MSNPDEEIWMGDNPKTGKTEKIYTVKDRYGRIHTVDENRVIMVVLTGRGA